MSKDPSRKKKVEILFKDAKKSEIKEILERIVEHEKYRSEGIVLFKETMTTISTLSKKMDGPEKETFENLAKEQVNQYLKNLFEFCKKQDEVYDNLLEISLMNSFSN